MFFNYVYENNFCTFSTQENIFTTKKRLQQPFFHGLPAIWQLSNHHENFTQLKIASILSFFLTQTLHTLVPPYIYHPFLHPPHSSYLVCHRVHPHRQRGAKAIRLLPIVLALQGDQAVPKTRINRGKTNKTPTDQEGKNKTG